MDDEREPLRNRPDSLYDPYENDGQCKSLPIPSGFLLILIFCSRRRRKQSRYETFRRQRPGVQNQSFIARRGQPAVRQFTEAILVVLAAAARLECAERPGDRGAIPRGECRQPDGESRELAAQHQLDHRRQRRSVQELRHQTHRHHRLQHQIHVQHNREVRGDLKVHEQGRADGDEDQGDSKARRHV